MPIPSNNFGMGGIVTPLTNKFNSDFLPEPANGETPVPLGWFNGGDIPTIVIRPEIKKEALHEVTDNPARELDVRKFFHGGI